MKKTVQKLLLALLVAMLCVNVKATVYNGTCGTSATWSYDDESYTLTISGTGDMANYTEALTDNPWNSYRTNISTVIIEGTVTSIGNWAFYGCTNLANVSINDDVESIGNEAFGACISLASINIPNGVQTLGVMAFDGATNLKSIRLGSGLNSIGNYAFSSCTSLKNLACLASAPPTVGANAFSGVTPTIIYVPAAKVATYQGADGWNTFAGAISAPQGNCGASDETDPATDAVTWSLDMETGALSLTGTGEIKTYYNEGHNVDPTNCPWNNGALNMQENYMWASIKSIVVNEGITIIPECAFAMQAGCTSVTLPSTLTTIGNSALEEGSYTSIVLPDGLLSIGDYAFMSTKLTSIVIPNSVTSIGTYAFAYSDYLASVTLPTNASYTTIEEGVFSGCPALTSINIPANVTTIGEMAFETTGLTSVTIPSTVLAIGDMSFEGCPDLTSVVISNGVTTIGATAFDGCTELTTIVIPAGVTSIGSGAFGGCTGVTDVYCYADPTSLTWTMDEWFADFKDEKGTKFHVVDESAWPKTSDTDDFYYLGQRVTFAEDLTVPANVTIEGYQWTTYYNNTGGALVADASTAVYKAKLSGTSLVLTEIGDRIINNGQAVILKSLASPGMVPSATNSGTSYDDNSLLGSATDVAPDASYKRYVLAYQNSKLGFYKLGDAVTIPAGKAYLEVPVATAPWFIDFSEEEGTPTKIEEPQSEVSEEDVIYTLQGQRVSQPLTSGIYIVNGKKVFIRK